MIELFLAGFIIIILSSVLYWSIKTGISPMFSSPKVSIFFNSQVKISKQNNIIDLGSGWGTLALYLSIKNPQKTIIGYELSSIPFYFSKLLCIIFRRKNLHFYNKNFLDKDFQEDSLYICYLFPKGMEFLEKKIKNSDIKVPLISSTFALPSLKYDRVERLNDILRTPVYLYHFNDL